MNHARSAQEHKANTWPNVVVRRDYYQRLRRRPRQMYQVYDDHGVN